METDYTRSTAATVASVVMALALGQAAAARAQSPPDEQAVQRCDQELTYRLGTEANGRDPQNHLAYRGLQVRPLGRSYRVTGGGRFMRDRFDRGREYTFDCTVDMRAGSARVTYRWSDAGFGNGYDDPGYSTHPSYRPRPGAGYAPPGAGPGTGNAGARPSYPASGRVFYTGGIINRASTKGLDVEGRSASDAANVQQWDFGGSPNQTWDVVDQGNGTFSILSHGSGKALDVAKHDGADGANILQFRFANGDDQPWRLERSGGGFYQIVSVSSGKCLDVNSAQLNENGGNVQQWSCSGAPNQQWRLGR